MSKKATMAFMYGMFFLFALGFILYSAVMPELRESYSLTLAEAGMIGSCLSAGQFVILLFNDLLARRFTKLRLILFCFAAYLLAMILICLAPPFWALLGAFFVIGMAVSLVNVVMSAKISDLFGAERDRYLNRLHGVYGVGSMAGPILPACLTALGLPWTSSFVVVTVLCAAVLLVFFRVDLGGEPTQASASDKGSLALLKDGGMLVVCAATLLYIGMDMTLCSWISSYLTDELHIPRALAGLSVTAYWVGSAVGRLAYPALFGGRNAKKYLLITNLLAILLFCGALGVRNAIVINAALALVGLLTGVGFPLYLGMGCALHPDSSVAAANDVTIAGSGGGMIFPNLVGALCDRAGYGAFPGVLTALFAGMALLMAVLLKRTSQQERRKQDAV